MVIVFRNYKKDFSLPTQRCFPPEKGKGAALDLFSAYAEVFPVVSDALAALAAFLCLRRGVSRFTRAIAPSESFSLPTQRCFQMITTTTLKGVLFSAYAEVFLKKKPDYIAIATFLCLRRGVSHPYRPKTRRPKLFSAYAEVFL